MKTRFLSAVLAAALLCLSSLLAPAVSEASSKTTYTYTFNFNGVDANFWSYKYLTSCGISKMGKITLRIVNAEDNKTYAKQVISPDTPVSSFTLTAEASANTALKAKITYDYDKGWRAERYGSDASTNTSVPVSITVQNMDNLPRVVQQIRNDGNPGAQIVVPNHIWNAYVSGDGVSAGRIEKITLQIRSGPNKVVDFGTASITKGQNILGIDVSGKDYKDFFANNPTQALFTTITCDCVNLEDNQHFVINVGGKTGVKSGLSMGFSENDTFVLVPAFSLKSIW